ncbi:MAG: DCC1-like thiol-disulfide oxidoreductase family protein [Candidatus Obscuribacterales bacterium]|nr:DCC1-like thiol-disulfide oxidoreductase family protein [Candidatus Obscuribacterales bacterium]
MAPTDTPSEQPRTTAPPPELGPKDRLQRWWQSFWFDPTSPTPMGLFRILVGVIALQCLLVHLLADWHLYFGDRSLIPIESMIGNYWRNDPYFDLMLLLPPGEIWRWYFFWFSVIVTVMMTVGLFTRFSSIMAVLCMISLQSHFLINQNSGDNFLRIAMVFVALSHAGDAFSIDNLLKSMRQDWRKVGFRPPLSAPWAQRMIQMQLSIAYFHTWWCKIQGAEWNDGTAVYYASRYDDIMRFPLPFLLDDIYIIKILTWGTLFVELALCTLIWWRVTRYYVLLLGLSLHMGIEYTMNLPMFEWLFMISFVLFIYPEDLTRSWNLAKGFIHSKLLKPYDLVFDGDCIICVRTVGLIHRMDIFSLVTLHNVHELEYVEWKSEVDLNRAPSEILLREKPGVWVGGFRAFRAIAWRLPWLTPIAPLLYLPGIAQIGDAVYKLVAANRYTILGGKCDHKSCTMVAS